MSYPGQVKSYTHAGNELRVFEFDRKYWFAAQDIAAMLKTTRNATQICSTLNEANKRTVKNERGLKMNLIDVDALVGVLRRSTKANEEGTDADVFRQWIMDKVIPSLMPSTMYRRMTQQEMQRSFASLEKRLLEMEKSMKLLRKE